MTDTDWLSEHDEYTLSDSVLLEKLLGLFYIFTDNTLEWAVVEGVSVGQKLGKEIEDMLIAKKRGIS